MPDSVARSSLVTISNSQGLHMRPAYLFAETAAKFTSNIELIKEDIRIDGKSVLSILTLGAAEGTQIVIEAAGEDADAAVAELENLLKSGFPEVQAAKALEAESDNA
jgi:phosphotransferase system HPr (HPr) family protein